MDVIPWSWIWLGLAALLYVGEMLTVTFFLLPFAIGATVAAIAAFLGAELWLQWVLMVAVSVVALLVVRPVAKKLTAKAAPEKSGVDRLIGMTGHIIEGKSLAGEERARVDREVWNVTTEDDTQLAPDTKIKVLKVDGAHLIVEAAS
jgi:membrane protein implicated in regulation of membrane protease activity